jgi:hypothetical protein
VNQKRKFETKQQQNKMFVTNIANKNTNKNMVKNLNYFRLDFVHGVDSEEHGLDDEL